VRDRSKYPEIKTLRCYSLVEMLMVITIIAILVGIGAGGYTVGRRWLSQSRTQGLLAKLKLAIESYKNDKGYYPFSTDSVVDFRLDANVKDFTGTVPSPNDHLQPRNNMSNYMDYAKLRDDQSVKFTRTDYYEYFVKDAWNAPADGETYGAVKYRCPGLINKTSFDLYSAGPDRKFAADPTTNKEDDIYAD
jgi:prepilin-type N-terminal cleavage/methylation domain-containing protein